MSSIRGVAMLGVLSVSLAACGTAQFYDFDGSLSGVVGLGTSWFPRDQYTKPATVNAGDFVPLSSGMVVHTERDIPLELNFSVDFRLRLAPWFYTGLTSDYLTFSGESSDACRFFNCRTIRYSRLDWWDPVALQDIALRRSPSFGVLVGLLGGHAYNRAVLQYAFTVQQYDITVRDYAGVDCVDCKNTSYVKTSTTISSGAAWRHTITFGVEFIRLAIWFEYDGPAQMSSGLNFILFNAMFMEKEDMKPR